MQFLVLVMYYSQYQYILSVFERQITKFIYNNTKIPRITFDNCFYYTKLQNKTSYWWIVTHNLDLSSWSFLVEVVKSSLKVMEAFGTLWKLLGTLRVIKSFCRAKTVNLERRDR